MEAILWLYIRSAAAVFIAVPPGSDTCLEFSVAVFHLQYIVETNVNFFAITWGISLCWFEFMPSDHMMQIKSRRNYDAHRLVFPLASDHTTSLFFTSSNLCSRLKAAEHICCWSRSIWLDMCHTSAITAGLLLSSHRCNHMQNDTRLLQNNYTPLHTSGRLVISLTAVQHERQCRNDWMK